jgi:hypothetical protein
MRPPAKSTILTVTLAFLVALSATSVGAAGDITEPHTDSQNSVLNEPGVISTVELTNTTDSNDNGEFASFDLYIEADTRLPAGNDDSDGVAEPRLKVLVNGREVYDNIEVAAQADLSGTIPIPDSALPTSDNPNLEVTVILWEDDPVDNDILDEYTITVPYEADESELRMISSRSSTVVGSPVYFGATGGSPGYDFEVVDAPSGSQAQIQGHTNTAVQLRPDSAGDYVIQATDSDGSTTQTEISVSEHASIIDRYAPILHYDREEQYQPTRYESMVENAILYDQDIVFDDIISESPSMFILGEHEDEPVMDLEGDEGDYPSYDNRYPPTVYANVDENVQFRGESYTTVTYWLFYVFDPKTDGLPGLLAHQSDLETVTVFINDEGPQWVAASQHKGGEIREWEKVDREGTHLHLFPAVGAHSNYLTNTENYDGDGILGQSQFASTTSESTEILSDTIYTDTTGSDQILSPTGDIGSDYDIVPLTGNEIWANFNGGFGDETDSGQVPMQRERWTDIASWAQGIPSDEDQRSVELTSLSTEVSGEMLEVSTTLENVGPKPDTFSIQVYAKPTSATWDSSQVTYLGSSEVPLGTERRVSATTAVEVSQEVSGSWDVLVVVSPHRYEVTEQEDVLASAEQTSVYSIERRTTTREPTTRNPTTAPPTATPTTVSTVDPSTQTTTPTSETEVAQSATSDIQTPTDGSGDTSTTHHGGTGGQGTDSDGGSPGFTASLTAIALLVAALGTRRR